MKQTRHSIQARLRAVSRKGAARLAYCACVAVAGADLSWATIDNAATATGSYGGNPVTSGTVTASVPVSSGGPALVVTKTASPDSNLVAGNVVTYTYTVRNTGTQVLSNVSLADTHDGYGVAPVPGNEILTTDAGPSNDSSDATPNDGVWSVLAPGDVITLTATYTITQSDVDLRQ
jgi:large repetitive protein